MQVCEIFASIQGESRWAGEPCTFVRSQGCNLRCRWCDTAWAIDPDGARAEALSAQAVRTRVAQLGWRYVCLTGGEPLLQADLPDVVAALLGDGRLVELQTNGTRDLAPIKGRWPEVRVVLDVKCPSSGMAARGAEERIANLGLLGPDDDIVFVLDEPEDFQWALRFVATHTTAARPSFGTTGRHLSPTELAERILRSRADVRLNLQLHKLLWDPNRRGV